LGGKRREIWPKIEQVHDSQDCLTDNLLEKNGERMTKFIAPAIRDIGDVVQKTTGDGGSSAEGMALGTHPSNNVETGSGGTSAESKTNND